MMNTDTRLCIQTLGPQELSAADDLACIMIAAWRAGFRGILPDDTIGKYTCFAPCRDMFRQILRSGIGTMYLARVNGLAVGLLYWLEEGNDARIEALLTVPEVWGAGVAAGLMEQALTDACNFQRVTVWPFAENHRARRFYEKQGFSPTGRSRMGDTEEIEYLRTPTKL